MNGILFIHLNNFFDSKKADHNDEIFKIEQNVIL